MEERPKEIEIKRQDLGGPKPVPDLTKVKVRINGAPAVVKDKKPESIKVEAPPTGEGPWMILLTTDDGKKLLCPLDLSYDPEKKTFVVKKQEGLGTEEPTLDDKVNKAAGEDATAADKFATAAEKFVIAAEKIAAAADKCAPPPSGRGNTTAQGHS